ncbi:uncharacterized protein LOC128554660 [Mercenaria mercenaria]|uniref:uncharacterized protein LOC128554660 n=1 Tax=Mercenaria mercenaria TaxID=6596 RepID=UPI00234E81CC|nr:uncharacterized protein LOC128554660 [Mercenaria mercenaria]
MANLIILNFWCYLLGYQVLVIFFTKVTRPLVKKWRGEGKLVSMFLDDGLGCAADFDSTLKLSGDIKGDLLLSGCIPNAEKSIWVPVQILEYLGVVLDSILGNIYIPERRLVKAKDTINSLLDALKLHRRVPVRKLASIVGQLISMSIVLGHVTQIMTRYLSADILTARHWDSYICVSLESVEQLMFWKANIGIINNRKLFELHRCSKIVYSDASRTGYAGYEVSTVTGVSHGIWDFEESNKSSTWRELEAVYRVLQSLAHILAHRRVKWFSDNQAITAIVKKGSMKKDLQDISYKIFQFCMRNSISLELEWIPRSENDKADYLSKIVDFDDWGISFEVFNILQERFGQFEVDWFASEYNAKVSKFYSRFWNPSSAGIDAFTEYWGNCFGLFVPSISVIYRVFSKMRADRANSSYKDDIDELPEVLADKVDLLPDLLRKSRAENTSRKYGNSFSRWERWAKCNGFGSGDILPAKAFPFAIYLASLIQTSNTPSPVISAFYAAKWFHDLGDLKSPTDSKLVINILEAAKRLLGKPTVKKEPVTTEMLLGMYNQLYSTGNLKNQRIICACLVAFSGFMRSSELLHIKVSDIQFYQSFMTIFVESSKTDRYRDGSWITIAKTEICLCPVVNVQKLISWATLKDDDYLFCNLIHSKNKYAVRKNNKAMSYSNLREEFLRALKPHVKDIKKYCLHSLRSGGATVAANSGIKDRLFKRHGRWCSDSAKDGYVKDDLRERLSVSLSLGL